MEDNIAEDEGREIALLIALQDQLLRKIISSHLGLNNNSLCSFGQITGSALFLYFRMKGNHFLPCSGAEELVNAQKHKGEKKNTNDSQKLLLRKSSPGLSILHHPALAVPL